MRIETGWCDPAAGAALVLLGIGLLGMSACRPGAQHPRGTLVVTNARVWTGDEARPSAEALAIAGGRIAAVGTAAEVDPWTGPETRVIDAGGALVVPGFNDSHVHFVGGSLQLDNVDLRDAATPEEFARRLGERAGSTAEGEWILGGDWDDQRWMPARLPTRDLIDGGTPDTPVFVSRYDGHMALANSLALRLAGVTASTPDPPGGTIVKDAAGRPTGVLKDAAMNLVTRIIPPLTPEKRMRAIHRGLQHAAALGVTSVRDMGPDAGDLAAYGELAERGDLTLRLSAAPSELQWQRQAQLGIRRGFGIPFFTMGAVKGFADGSLGSTTAYFFEPYADAPGTQGLLADEMIPVEGMRERLGAADAAGLQLCIHAIGDRAISMMLDIFADIARANGARDRRFRIEHAQHVARKDFARFASLGVIAAVQPYHAIDDGRWAERRIGAERIRTTYAFRSFLDAGARLALGSDWPVAPLSPMLAIYAAATRATLDGENPSGWVPEQKITVEEALRAYTAGSAYAEFQEGQKGTLAPGMLADLVILSEDILTIAPERIKDVTVRTTIVGGRIVHE
ncbi:MAG: amidohydrolase [Acidobacteriota bacterium]